jgi:hypothetical protein
VTGERYHPGVTLRALLVAFLVSFACGPRSTPAADPGSPDTDACGGCPSGKRCDECPTDEDCPDCDVCGDPVCV